MLSGPGKSRCRPILLVGLAALAASLISSAPAPAAPAWLPPLDLSKAGANAFEPQVAVDAAGDTVAVWGRFNGTNAIVQSSSRPAGSSFSAPVDLSQVGGNATQPRVAVDAAGNAVVVWSRFDGANNVIQAAFRPVGGGFSAPVDLSLPGKSAFAPQIAMNAAGEAVAVWERSNGTNVIVQGSIRPAGGSFSAPADLSQAGGDADEPQVAIDGAGDAVAVWQRSNGTNTIVQEAFRLAGSGFSAPVDLSQAGGNAVEPAVAVNAAGEAAVAWVRSNGTNTILQSSVRPPGGSFSTPADLSQPGGNAGVPQVALDAAGDAIAVWARATDPLGTNAIVQEAFRPAGGSFSAPGELSGAGADFPQIALDGAGNAAAVWQRFNGIKTIIQGSNRLPGSGFSAPADLSPAGQAADRPQVGLNAAGDGAAIWARSNGTNTIIQVAGFDGTAPQLRSLSIPTAGRAGARLRFSVSPFDVWSATEAHWSFGDGAKADTAQAAHIYKAPGSYHLTLTATDAVGNTTSIAKTITIKPAPRAIGDRSAKVRHGAALLRLRCPASEPCKGLAKLTVRHGKAKFTLGMRRFRIAPHRAKTIAIKLSARARGLLAAAAGKRLAVRLEGSGLKPATVRLKG
jgi:PKD domain